MTFYGSILVSFFFSANKNLQLVTIFLSVKIEYLHSCYSNYVPKYLP